MMSSRDPMPGTPVDGRARMIRPCAPAPPIAAYDQGEGPHDLDLRDGRGGFAGRGHGTGVSDGDQCRHFDGLVASGWHTAALTITQDTDADSTPVSPGDAFR